MEILASKSAGKQIERSKGGYKPSKIAQKMFADLFEYEGLKEFVEKFNLNKDFPRIFNMTVSLNDSENSYFTVSIFYDSTIDKQTYVFEVNGEKAKYFSGVYSWKLRVDADGDVLVSALSCVYFLTECVKNRNFSYVPVYMDMLAGLLA